MRFHVDAAASNIDSQRLHQVLNIQTYLKIFFIYRVGREVRERSRYIFKNK